METEKNKADELNDWCKESLSFLKKSDPREATESLITLLRAFNEELQIRNELTEKCIIALKTIFN